jgi:hypothetical protein
VSANDATSVSLIENFHRQAIHPADAFEAFATLITEGKRADDLAADFAVSTLYMQQCIKLANIAPALLDQYRAGLNPLDCIKALAVTDDHTAQLAAWARGKAFPSRDTKTAPMPGALEGDKFLDALRIGAEAGRSRMGRLHQSKAIGRFRPVADIARN